MWQNIGFYLLPKEKTYFSFIMQENLIFSPFLSCSGHFHIVGKTFGTRVHMVDVLQLLCIV